MTAISVGDTVEIWFSNGTGIRSLLEPADVKGEVLRMPDPKSDGDWAIRDELGTLWTFCDFDRVRKVRSQVVHESEGICCPYCGSRSYTESGHVQHQPNCPTKDTPGIDDDFALASDHHYECRCNVCLTWWAKCGPAGMDPGDYGPFSKEEVNAEQRKLGIEETP